MFLDTVTIYVKAGNGGNGCVSFHREKYVSRGGPDGGEGGKGGDIVFQASEREHTLLHFRYQKHFRAENGEDGRTKNQHGKNGEDLVIEVPPGTIVRDSESGDVVADIYEAGVPVVLLHGGRGGRGNAQYATSTRQSPHFAQNGQRTVEYEVRLEMKTIADVGLIGFPNVGKSTLLAAASAARPKIAGYHFTTLAPNLGVVQVGESSFVMADIPGLIEGAHEGAGLGHDFLRHIERTRLLLHLVDVSGSEGRDPVEDLNVINEELRQFSQTLSRLPQIVVGNKIDALEDEESLARLRARAEEMGCACFAISAAAVQGVGELMRFVLQEIAKLPPVRVYASEALLEKPVEDTYTVERRDEAYVVAGSLVDKIAAAVNLDDQDSFRYFQQALRRTGIIDALREAGAKEGDTVCVSDVEFEFVE